MSEVYWPPHMWALVPMPGSATDTVTPGSTSLGRSWDAPGGCTVGLPGCPACLCEGCQYRRLKFGEIGAPDDDQVTQREQVTLTRPGNDGSGQR